MSPPYFSPIVEFGRLLGHKLLVTGLAQLVHGTVRTFGHVADRRHMIDIRAAPIANTGRFAAARHQLTALRTDEVDLVTEAIGFNAVLNRGRLLFTYIACDRRAFVRLGLPRQHFSLRLS